MFSFKSIDIIQYKMFCNLNSRVSFLCSLSSFFSANILLSCFDFHRTCSSLTFSFRCCLRLRILPPCKNNKCPFRSQRRQQIMLAPFQRSPFPDIILNIFICSAKLQFYLYEAMLGRRFAPPRAIFVLANSDALFEIMFMLCESVR